MDNNIGEETVPMALPSENGYLPPAEDGRPDDDDIDSLEVQSHSHTDPDLTSEAALSEHIPKSRNRNRSRGPGTPGQVIIIRDPSSRAKPLKPHEPTPFLSVDNLPLDKRISREQSARSKAGRVASGQTLRTRSPKTPTNTPQLHNHRPVTASRVGSDFSGPTTKARKYILACTEPKPPNRHIKAPFKHAVNNPEIEDQEEHPTSPSQELIEKTTVATYQVAKAVRKQKPPEEKKIQGKLLKGKLKPLSPVKMDGPQIQHCRGIVPEPRTYTASPSRTLQRRRQLMNNLVKQRMYGERPRTVESIHRTSVASSLSEHREQDLVDDLEADQDHLGDGSEEVTLSPSPMRMPPNSLASVSGLTNSQAVESPTKPFPEDGTPYETDLVSHTEESDGQVTVQGDADNNGQQTVDPDKTEVKVIPAAEEWEEESTILVGGEKLEGNVDQDDTDPLLIDSRPQTVNDNQSRKSVRFAESDENESVPRSKSAAPVLQGHRKTASEKEESDEEKENKKKHKSKKTAKSCKSSDLKTKPGDEDPGPGGHGGSRNPPSDQDPSGNAPSGAGTGEASSNGGKYSRGPQGGDSGGKQQSMSVPVRGVVYSKGNATVSARYKRPATPTRPRSNLGNWEDHYKPDTDVTGLTIVGRQSGEFETPQAVRPTTEAPPGGSSGRPGSAKVKKKSATKTKTPASGRLISGSPYVSGAAGRTYKKTLRPQSAKMPKSPEVKPRKHKRPQSAGAVPAKVATTQAFVEQPWSADIPVKSIEFDSSLSVRSSGAWTQGGKTGPRPMSGRSLSSFPTASTENQEFIVEGSKMSQSARDKISSGQRTLEELIDSGQSSEDEDEILFRKEDENQELGQNPGVPVDRDSAPAGGPDTDLQTKFDEIDEQINAVQGEVQRAADRLEMMAEDQGKDDTEREAAETGGQKEELTEETETKRETQVEEDTEEQGEKGWEPEQPMREYAYQDLLSLYREKAMLGGDKCGEISGQLTTPRVGQHMYDIEVYQFEESAEQPWMNKEEEEEEEDLEGELAKPGADQSEEGTSGGSQPEQKIADGWCLTELPPNGEITSYSVTMMSDDVGDLGLLKSKDGPFSSPEALQGTLKQMLSQDGCTEDLQKPEQPAESSQERSDDSGNLEVVAKAKTLSNKSTDATPGPIAPYPPICFRVNARPPPGYLYYFAYGIDMNPNRLASYIRREVIERLWGLLFGFKLLFNKKGEDTTAGGFPNIEFNPVSSVEGCLYLITPDELELLDRCVGYPQHYEHMMLPVWMLNCSDPENYGVAQYCVPALMYIAQDKWRHQGEVSPNEYIMDQCVKSADLVTSDYKEQLTQLKQTATVPATPVAEVNG